MSGDDRDDGDDHRTDDSERHDPFDDLDGYADREGDPFDHLDGDRSGDHNDPADDHGDDEASDRTPTDASERDPFEYMEGPDEREGVESAGDDGPERTHEVDVTVPAEGPLGDVDIDVSGDPFESGGGTFDDAGVEGVDPDEVWDRLAGEADADADLETGAGTAPEDDVVAVSKHDFCETCEFFSPPPEVHCTHEGTDILEFVDVETVRVANCPVVAERRELGGLEE